MKRLIAFLLALTLCLSCFAGFSESMDALKRQAQACDTEAMVELADIYLDDYDDTENALYWFKQAAERGDADGMLACGLM